MSMNNLYSFKGRNTVYPTLGISFTDMGKRVNWSRSFLWGIQVYTSGGYDVGNIFRIRQIKKAVPRMQGLGLNELLVPSLLHPFSVRHPTPVTPQAPLASSQ